MVNGRQVLNLILLLFCFKLRHIGLIVFIVLWIADGERSFLKKYLQKSVFSAFHGKLRQNDIPLSG